MVLIRKVGIDLETEDLEFDLDEDMFSTDSLDLDLDENEDNNTRLYFRYLLLR
jgi:hypothetical protein